MKRMKLGAGLFAAAIVAGGGAAVFAQTGAGPDKRVIANMDFLPGYISRDALPNSLDILPPAPTRKSATQARDVAAAAAARKLKGSRRWDVARQDADLHFPAAADDFSCALGVKISPQTTPRLYVLLRRTLTDAGLSTYPTKNQFMRARPFTVKGGAICTPEEDDALRHDGSYPSGHSAIGWAWALILAEAAPDRANAVLARGRAFLESRVACNVHWLSDTEAGAMMGSAVAARLHDEPEFRADLEA
ncbi:MAG: phosphatase PAP2 family protein, partial [Sphingomonas bacterium]